MEHGTLPRLMAQVFRQDERKFQVQSGLQGGLRLDLRRLDMDMGVRQHP